MTLPGQFGGAGCGPPAGGYNNFVDSSRNTIDPLSKRVELVPLQHRTHQRTYTFSAHWSGFFAKVIGLIVGVALLVLAFSFSLLIFSLMAVLVLAMLAYSWWGRIRGRSLMRVGFRR
jgi:VIT1/CCC1 family predicted Fe2+/Mn2+ transporter